eukprot:TCONS_00047905-protein
MGRFVSGLGRATNLVATNYIQKLFPEDDLFYKMTILSNFVTVGTVIGPVLTYIFIQIDFNLGALNLNFGNSPGFYMCLCKMFLFVCLLLFMDDIPFQSSRERFQYQPKNRLQEIVCTCAPEEDEDEKLIQKFDAQEEFLKEQDNDDSEIEIKSKKKVPLKKALSETLRRKKVLAVLMTLFVHGMTFKIINSLIPVESW